jgi:hypothetical protein
MLMCIPAPGQQFVFNMGGGPGFRVHQFGGQRPRRRPREANGQEEPAPSGWNSIQQLLPLILLVVIPLLSSLFSGSSSTASGPTFRFDAAVPPHTMQRTTTVNASSNNSISVRRSTLWLDSDMTVKGKYGYESKKSRKPRVGFSLMLRR